jgi:hypothetical protein
VRGIRHATYEWKVIRCDINLDFTNAVEVSPYVHLKQGRTTVTQFSIKSRWRHAARVVHRRSWENERSTGFWPFDPRVTGTMQILQPYMTPVMMEARNFGQTGGSHTTA